MAMYWHDGGWGASGWILMSVLMLVFWAAIVVGIVALVRSRPTVHSGGHPWPPAQPPAAGPDMARRILDERFARGEIDEDEYRRRRDVLGGS